MSRDKQIEMRNRHVNSWSHINCDEPVLWSHQTKISRFPQTLEQYECGMCIQEKFSVTVGGKETHWELRIYPNGYDEDTAGFLALFVKLDKKEGSTAQYLLKSEISILDVEGSKKITCDLPGKVLSSKQMHGTKKFILREQLMGNSQIYIDESVTFLLEVEICLPDSKISGVEKNEGLELKIMQKQVDEAHKDITYTLKNDFSGLLNSSEHFDTVINCSGQEFKCHKAILAARSDVFSAMFQHQMTENQSNKVDIKDLTPNGVKLMLEFIYSGKFDENVETAMELLPAADKYMLDDLRRACEKYLCMMVNLNNCLDLLILSDTHTANILNTHCIKFVVENLTKISNENSLETKLNAKIMSQIIKATAAATSKHTLERKPSKSAKKRKKELTSFANIFLNEVSSESDEEEEEDEIEAQ